MATRKYPNLDDFAQFWGVLESYVSMSADKRSFNTPNVRIMKPYPDQKENYWKKLFLVAMVTIKLSILDDFGYFPGFSLVHTRGSGAGAPDMGHLIHKSDRLFNTYVNSKKKMKQSVAVAMVTI